MWHCRLGHISRGIIERLVKNEILPPLEFSDIEQCIDCIKGKFVKQIKKGVNRSTATLEIIHTDICGDPISYHRRLNKRVLSVQGLASRSPQLDSSSREEMYYPRDQISTKCSNEQHLRGVHTYSSMKTSTP